MLEQVFKQPARILLVLLFTLLISNRSSAAFVVRHAHVAATEAAEAAPAAATEVEAQYNEIKTRLFTHDYKFYNFDRPGRVFDGQRKSTNYDLAWAGGICVMVGIGGAVVAAGFNLEDVVTYCAVGLIAVGVILIAIGLAGVHRSKKGFAVTAPKNNEVGIAYNF